MVNTKLILSPKLILSSFPNIIQGTATVLRTQDYNFDITIDFSNYFSLSSADFVSISISTHWYKPSWPHEKARLLS